MSALKFRLAVLMHDRAVFRVAAAVLRDSREAEDVTQEVFLSYWQHGETVERPREWLLRALVDTLPEPQRSLLVMFDMQGMDGATCARVLGLNINQVKEGDGWHAVVRVRDGDEQVRVYMKPGTGGTLAGVTVMVMDSGGSGGGGEAVFLNVAGAIHPAQLGQIASTIGMNGMFRGVPGLPGPQD